jgi:hypothetical protein
MEEPEQVIPRGKAVPLVPSVLHEGKDEMNFAEFPLGIISKRAEANVNTLVFEDTINDRNTGVDLPRKLTITTSDLLGLPTSTDDEVLLGLIQLSKLQGFESRKVYFTRYQLLRLLGWAVNGQNYDRIKTALKRWSGVTLLYDGAWRDQSAGRWGDGAFHVLDNFDLDPSENESTRPKPAPNQMAFEYAASSFIWNEKVFQSFHKGNLKALDFSFVMGLRSAISRRLYRFLDKRFFKMRRLEFDMRTLAYEKIGISRGTAIADVKRQLLKAMDELVSLGFLRDIPTAERVKKVGVGNYRLVFVRAGERDQEENLEPEEQPELPLDAKTLSPLEAALSEAGIKGHKVRELAKNYSEELIKEKLEVLAYLVAKKAKQVENNPAGFLIRSIEDNYENPRGFVSTVQKAKKEEAERTRIAKGEAIKKRQAAVAQEKQKALDELLDGFWSGLSEEDRKKEEEAALAKASDFEKRMLSDGGEYIARSVLFARHARARLLARGVRVPD